jgi:predicted nucleic acid-binding protein
MTHLLDTDTCIGVLRQRPGMVQRLSQVAPTDCAVSMITVYELFCGLARALDPAKERQKVERFISAIIEMPLDRAGAEAAANIRAELERQGHAHRALRLAHRRTGSRQRPHTRHQQRRRIQTSQRIKAGILAVKQIAEEEALKRKMEAKSREFTEKGSELYAKA